MRQKTVLSRLSVVFTAALSIVFLCFPATGYAIPPEFAVYFTDPANDSGGGMDTALIALLDGATSRVDAHIYQLNHPPVVQAFIDAAERIGACNVRLITDEKSYVDSDYTNAYGTIEAAGIPLITQTCAGFDGSDLQSHNKYVIVDHNVVWTGSWNITTDATEDYNENSIRIESVELAATFTEEFEEQWGSDDCTPGCGVTSRFGRQKTRSLNTSFLVGNTPVEAFFTPGDDARNAIIRELETADEAIYFCLFTFTRDDLSLILRERYAAGIDVKGIVDRFQATGRFAELHKMAPILPVKEHNTVNGNGFIMHHKFVVIDPFGNDPRVITGAYNWTTSAETQNDENLLIIRDREIAEAYYCEFYERFTGTACVSPPLNSVDFPMPGPGFDASGVYLTSQRDVFQPGDTIELLVGFAGSPQAERNYLTYIALEVGGVFYFLPSATEVAETYPIGARISPSDLVQDWQVFFGPAPSPALPAPLLVTFYAAAFDLNTNSFLGEIAALPLVLE